MNLFQRTLTTVLLFAALCSILFVACTSSSPVAAQKNTISIANLDTFAVALFDDVKAYEKPDTNAKVITMLKEADIFPAKIVSNSEFNFDGSDVSYESGDAFWTEIKLPDSKTAYVITYPNTILLGNKISDTLNTNINNTKYTIYFVEYFSGWGRGGATMKIPILWHEETKIAQIIRSTNAKKIATVFEDYFHIKPEAQQQIDNAQILRLGSYNLTPEYGEISLESVSANLVIKVHQNDDSEIEHDKVPDFNLKLQKEKDGKIWAVQTN